MVNQFILESSKHVLLVDFISPDLVRAAGGFPDWVVKSKSLFKSVDKIHPWLFAHLVPVRAALLDLRTVPEQQFFMVLFEKILCNRRPSDPGQRSLGFRVEGFNHPFVQPPEFGLGDFYPRDFVNQRTGEIEGGGDLAAGDRDTHVEIKDIVTSRRILTNKVLPETFFHRIG